MKRGTHAGSRRSEAHTAKQRANSWDIIATDSSRNDGTPSFAMLIDLQKHK